MEDLAELLRYALPSGGRFPNWRDPFSDEIAKSLAWPLDGMCFDIEHDAFWMPEWGERPEPLEQACAIAREAVRSAPVLIPIFGHRYMPATPSRGGNPVFSVHQTDIIFYGYDLPDYLHKEFGVPNPFEVPEWPLPEIEFWTRLEELNG